MSTEATTAFSAQAGAFDRIDAANPLIAWVRDRVRIQALATMRPGDTLLELNAGTGIDSCFFAAQGMQVLATDAAPGMIEQLRLKQAAEPKLPLDVMHCSFLDLERLGDRRFHHVFSNFGGLNCTAHLDEVLRGIDRVLLPNGTCTLVIMPRFSPWELLAALKGTSSWPGVAGGEAVRKPWWKDTTSPVTITAPPMSAAISDRGIV
ncbi:MAG: class I SAM-dependent methyltransferase [Flavobacteriales bacterium]|nr:class I SAM-dependent methyltransferase [Flavobacteriales bacterium]